MNKPKHKSKQNSKEWIPEQYQNVLDFALPLLFILIPFVPYHKSIDEIGFQWLLMAILDIVTCLYIIVSRNTYSHQEFDKLRSPIVYSFAAFFLCSLISILYAINPTESVIQASRILIVFVACLNMIILYNHNMFPRLALGIMILLLIEVIQNSYSFFNQAKTISFDQLVLSIKGNMGSKNVLSAAIVWKIPFVCYFLKSKNQVLKLISLLTLFLSTHLLFILNTRSSFISLLIISLIYILILVGMFFNRTIKIRVAVRYLTFYTIPIILAIVSSSVLINTIKSYPINTNNNENYGTVFERVKNIDFQQGSIPIRLSLWEDAFISIKNHPFTGCGIGNWKIASIKFTKFRDNDYFVPYHAHNDFLEYTAELGVIGGLTFVLLLLTALLRLYRIFKKNTDSQELLIHCAILATALLTYMIDAFLNFPCDRPPMQISLFITLACIVCIPINDIRFEKERSQISSIIKVKRIMFIYGFMITLLFPILFIGYKVHESFILQKQLLNPVPNGESYLSEKFDKMIDSKPIPNLNYYTVPIDAVIANLMIEEEKIEAAKTLLYRSIKDNPYLGVNELYLSRLYQQNDQQDSAVIYARIAFNKRPRSRIAYFNYLTCLAKVKDVTSMETAFREYIKYRNKYAAWELYISLLSDFKPVPYKHLQKIIDSALIVLPNRKNDLNQLKTKLGIPFDMHSNITSEELIDRDEFKQMMNKGSEYFNKGQYQNALNYFLKIPNQANSDYAYRENIGLCYYGLKEYNKALQYFESIIMQRQSSDGKAEFFAGMCYIMMGNLKKGCVFLSLARSKNYNTNEVDAQSAYYCR